MICLTNQELLYELTENMSTMENEIKNLLDDAQLDEKTYDVLYDFGAKVFGAMEANNRTFLKYLSEK